MSTRNWNLGRLGLAVAALAALSITACDPYIKANTAAPVVLGAAVVDVNANEFAPYAYEYFGDACTAPYPEPDPAWANATYPGLCDPSNLAKSIPTVCPVGCYPPRSGPAFAPFYTGNTGGSYQAVGGVPYSYALPTDGKYTVLHVPPGPSAPLTPEFAFAQIWVQFNKLLAGATVQPDPARCLPATDANGIKVYKISPASSVGIGADVTVSDGFAICYVPNSATDYWGAAITATPAAFELDPDTKYTVRGVVQDQQGNSVTVDVTAITDAAAPPAAPRLR